MQNEDHLHEMSKSIFWEKLEKYFNTSSVGNFTQSAKSLSVLFIHPGFWLHDMYCSEIVSILTFPIMLIAPNIPTLDLFKVNKTDNRYLRTSFVFISS